MLDPPVFCNRARGRASFGARALLSVFGRHMPQGRVLRKMTARRWKPAPERLTLARDEVHVFRVPFEALQAYAGRLESLLDPAERERADRMPLARVRWAFVATHGLIRVLLARALGVEPTALRFVSGPHGKPALAWPESRLRFNLSHAGDRGLLAIARDKEVGADVERLRQEVDVLALAGRFYAPAEAAALRRLPPSRRVRAFFRSWTRKEAYIKARGERLLPWIGRVEFPLADVGTHEIDGWILRDVDPGPGYVAAVCVQGRTRPWHRWDAATLLS
jgi:4'-phosphopantetheinyl transferase